jgi:uncharacterized glyoxalase superfamily protein PhnB
VKDVNQLYEEIKDKVDIITPIASQEWGHRNFTIQDPAGVKLKFFSLV